MPRTAHQIQQEQDPSPGASDSQEALEDDIQAVGLVLRILTQPIGWRHSVVVNALALINVVNRHWARLVLGWVTVCGWVNHLGM